MLTPATLLSELQADPSGLGYGPYLGGVDSGTGADGNIEHLINTKNYAMAVNVPIGTVKVWVAQQGMLFATLSGHAATVTDPLYPLCVTFLNVLNTFDSINFADPATATLLASAVQAGLITGAQESALAGLGTYTGSRAEVLWGAGSSVTSGMIAYCQGRTASLPGGF